MVSQDFSLLIKGARIKWKVVCTAELVHLANQLFHTLDESLKKEITKFLVNSSKLSLLNGIQNIPSFCYCCKAP